MAREEEGFESEGEALTPSMVLRAFEEQERICARRRWVLRRAETAGRVHGR
jgi:hypothetical protein